MTGSLQDNLAIMDNMYTEELRLKSFKNWPFGDNSLCSAAKMAEAGFFHCPTENEPDSVQCYVCFKELDGWEENDEPWSEHYSHSKNCIFAKLRKPQKQLIVDEIFMIEAERKKNKAAKVASQRLKEYKDNCAEIEDYIVSVIRSLGGKVK